jgi:hypothetical protein
MELKTTAFGWLLAMDEGRVQRIEVDFRLGLLFGDKAETALLCIEMPCYLRREGRDILLTPDDPSSLAPVLAIFNAEVADISIQRTGHLTAKLKDGRSLEVDPNEQYEAWQISSTNGFLLVCSPGGEVSLFQQGRVKGQKDGPSENL